MASSSNFALNIISWEEASIGVPNHQVHYIPRDHLANPMNWGALVIVKASRRAPTHLRLVCIYKDKWTEVHWNTEAKTYTLGERTLQLDKYNTKGSNVQVLVDKELEKTSEEDSTSKAESEEELKEPGPSIDNWPTNLLDPNSKIPESIPSRHKITSQPLPHSRSPHGNPHCNPCQHSHY